MNRPLFRKPFQLLTGLLMVGMLSACGAQSAFDDSKSKSEGEAGVHISLENDSEPLDALVPVSCKVTWQRELLIIEPKVVANAAFVAAGKPWHFGTLMRGATPSGVVTSAMLKSWLNTIGRNTTINGLVAEGREGVPFWIGQWPKIAGSNAFDINKSPFRLLAIVYRPDLAIRSINRAGEVHFVFQGTYPGGLEPLTVSLDYRLIGDRAAWARKFHSLHGVAPTDARFPVLLEGITRLFTVAQPSTAPLRGNLMKVLTNEFAWGSPREMREFHLTSSGLTPAPVAGTPSRALDKTTTLSDAIRSLKGSVPLMFEGKPFRGPISTVHNPNSPGAGPLDLWSAPGISAATMKSFSGKTCGGCHGSITATVANHVVTSDSTHKTVLSRYLLAANGLSGEVISRSNTMQKLLCPTAY